MTSVRTNFVFASAGSGPGGQLIGFDDARTGWISGPLEIGIHDPLDTLTLNCVDYRDGRGACFTPWWQVDPPVQLSLEAVRELLYKDSGVVPRDLKQLASGDFTWTAQAPGGSELRTLHIRVRRREPDGSFTIISG